MTGKKLLGLFFVFVTLILVGYIFYSVFYFSNVEVSVEGEHDPTKSLVLVGEQKIYPSENEGRLYTAKVRPGTKTVSYGAYNMTTQDEDIKFSIGSTQKVVFKTTAQSPEATASKVVVVEAGEKISSAIYFNNLNEAWLVAKVSNGDSSVPDKFSIYRYPEDQKTWSLVLSDSKISDKDKRLASAPEELRAYILEEAGD